MIKLINKKINTFNDINQNFIKEFKRLEKNLKDCTGIKNDSYSTRFTKIKKNFFR